MMVARAVNLMANLTAEQAAAAHAPASVAVTAGAGSGKTFMLAERYLFYVMELGRSPLEIVAVTFTKKAAAELRSRIRKRVQATFGPNSEVLAELEAAPICTMHALAARICRDWAEVLDLPPDFQIFDDRDVALWTAEQLDRAFAKLPLDAFAVFPYSQLRTIMEFLLDDPIASDRALNADPHTWESTLHDFQKAELQQLLTDPEWQMATDILYGVSGKSNDKLEAYRHQAVTAIAALADGRINDDWLSALTSLKVNCGATKNWPDADILKEVKAALKSIRQLAETAQKETTIALRRNEQDDRLEALYPLLRDVFDRLLAHLDAAKHQARRLTYNDLERHALAALVRPEVRRHYAQRWQAFLIDEFQDTNPVQGELLEALAREAVVTIVGDDKQSIYGFRRADVEVFRAWRDRIAAMEGGRSVSLTCSFRTHRPLVEQINTLCRPLLGELHQALTSTIEPPDLPRGEAPYIRVGIVENAIATESEPEPESQANGNDKTPNKGKSLKIQQQRAIEGQFLVEQVRHWCDRGYTYQDMAILGRSWDPLLGYGEALERAGIPFVVENRGNILTSREAEDGYALLRFLADARDSLALVAVLRSPWFAIDDRTLYETAQRLPRAATPTSSAPSTLNLDPISDPTTHLITHPTTDSTINLTTDSTINLTTDSTINLTTDSTTESTANPTTNLITNSTTNLTANSTTNLTANPTTNLITDSTTNLITDSTTNLITDSTTNLTANPTANPTAHPTANLIINSTTDSTIDSTIDSTTNLTTDSTPASTTHPTRDDDPLPWWDGLQQLELPAPLATAVATLRTLRQGRSHHAPTRLLQQADYLTGYTGAIAHLNNAERRIAHWQDFFDLVRDLEQGSEDLFGTVRRLKPLFAGLRDRQSKVAVKPQRLSAGNAVTLITIHSAKGLEWPIVFLSNLDYKPPTSNQDGMDLDPELGVALKRLPEPSIANADDPQASAANRPEEPPPPARYLLLQALAKQRDRAELARLLYVGLTRARDRLILTSAKAEVKNSAIALLESGFNAARLEPIPITASPAAAERGDPVWPKPRDLPPAWVGDRPLIGPVSAGIIDLDVTSLSDYHYCPQRFRFAALDRHPGAYDDSLDGTTHARRTGLLTHAAIEHFGRQPAALESAPTLDELQTWIAQSSDLGIGTGDRQLAADAATFAHRFFSHPAYAPYRTATARPEQSLQLTLAGLTLNGRADWVGEDFVLEFKTGDRPAMTPAEQEGHALQVWAYAQALGKTQGAIAYLRSPTGDLETLTVHDSHWRTQAETLARAILHQNLDPTPDPPRCKRCPYHPLCPAALSTPP